MLKLKAFLCTLCLLILTARRSAYSVVMPDRSILLNPLSRSVEGAGAEFLPLIGGWAELDKFAGMATDSDHCFDARLGAAAEVFRLGRNYDFTVSSDVELVATPDSPILFNPRALFWQETFQFGAAMDSSFLHLGYAHRCKHDIDNIQVQDSTGERSIMVYIYDSLFARWILQPGGLSFRAGSPCINRLYCRTDIFVLSSDERSGSMPDKNANNLRYGFSGGLDCTVFRSRGFTAYSRLNYSLYIFSSGYNTAGAWYREFSADYSAEAGISFAGDAGAVSLFIIFEKQDMTMINPQNESAYFISAGVRLSGTDMYY
ncbi:MAG TPA: hypothetical protein PK514_12070 [Spirochaetota bacterium]|nr:hypothetical protein [Spirochaetota bacterium]